MPNPILNNRFLKEEHLLSAYKHLCKIKENEQSYFVTIQPLKKIWNEVDATEYINTFLPNTAPIVVLLEHNTKTSYKRNSKTFDLEADVHIHAFIKESDLKHFKDIVIYRDETDLNNKKKALGVKSLHIVAKVFKGEPPTYLVKQSKNVHIPFRLNFKERVLKPLKQLAEVCLSQPIYIRKPQPMTNTQHIYTLLHLFNFGSTYDQTIRLKKKEKPPLNTIAIKQLLTVFALKDKLLIKSPLNKAIAKHPPFMPNAPTILINPLY